MVTWRKPIMGDLKSFQERFIALRQAIIADGLRHGLPSHSDDLRTLLERVKNEGTSFVEGILPQLGRALDRGLVSGTFACPAHFGLRRETRLPRLFYGLFSRIFDVDGNLLAEPCPVTIHHLRQILLLDSKLIREPSAKEKELAVQGFRDRMYNLRKKKIPVNCPILQDAKRILGSALRELDLTNIVPGHGPGAVAKN
jgi:hypothetical protein